MVSPVLKTQSVFLPLFRTKLRSPPPPENLPALFGTASQAAIIHNGPRFFFLNGPSLYGSRL